MKVRKVFLLKEAVMDMSRNSSWIREKANHVIKVMLKSNAPD